MGLAKMEVAEAQGVAEVQGWFSPSLLSAVVQPTKIGVAVNLLAQR